MGHSGIDLDGRVAVVTGSTKGIGRGFAFGLAEAGANVVITSRNQEQCDEVAGAVRGVGIHAIGKACDVTNWESINGLIEAVMEEFGRIDILVNNAGQAITKRAEDLTEADWDRVVNVDLKGVFSCSMIAGKKMIEQKSGNIINVASVLGLGGERQVLPYCSAKGGVIQMTRALALEWAKYGIRVNALCPGYIKTELNEADMVENERIYRHIVGKTPMRRLGEVQELVGGLVYLASDASSFMTGQTMVIDGGWTAE